MAPPPGTLSDLLAAEKELLLRHGPSGYHLSTQMPTVDDLKLLHEKGMLNAPDFSQIYNFYHQHMQLIENIEL